jgi:hypothetical protein
MSTLRVYLQGVGLLGPGLASWTAAQPVLRGVEPHVCSPTPLPSPERLPSAERRRAGAAIKLAMAVADEAVAQAAIDPHALATVFTSSSGEGLNCHLLCEALAGADRLVSPTRFTNSVHNAAAGYWHIAVASRAPSTSLCAYGASFGAGLLEAATQVLATNAPVLLVASDTPYPEPLNACRPLPDNFGAALLLAPAASTRSLAALEIALAGDAQAGATSTCDDPSLEALRAAVPAAAPLPLLQALARGDSKLHVVFDLMPALKLGVAIHALASPS